MREPERFIGRINESVRLANGLGADVLGPNAGEPRTYLGLYTRGTSYQVFLTTPEARRLGELLIACADEGVVTDPRVSATDSCDSPPLGAGLDPNAAIHDPADSIDVEPS